MYTVLSEEPLGVGGLSVRPGGRFVVAARGAGCEGRRPGFTRVVPPLAGLPCDAPVEVRAAELAAWLRHCAQFGLYEEGVILFEGSGVTVQHLERIPYNPAEEETGYDAARGYADICRRRLPRQLRATDRDDNEDEEVEEMNDNE